MEARGHLRSCLATNRPPHSCPVPLALPRPTPHLRRRTLQGVAVQQDDLQVPEAAEGDRDAGDAVTGEIQAHKRKVP